MAESEIKPTVYVETTIPSYLTSRPSTDPVIARQQQVTKDWWRTAADQFNLFVSQPVLDEITRGDLTAIRERVDSLKHLEVLPNSQDAIALAQEYQSLLRLPAKALNDALHLAYAVVFEMDYLLTWNMRHLASSFTMRQMTAFNTARSLHVPLVVTPEYLVELDEPDE